jgi:N-acetylneuraminate synthase
MKIIKRPFLIAEIGINHNGSLDIAKKLIIKSKEARFNAVKFQKRDIYKVYTKEQLQVPRESPWGSTTEEQKKGLEFEKKEYDEIDKYCREVGIDWFASAWDVNSLNFLKQYDLKYNKVASAMIVDKEFLKEIAKQKKYTFISTGMSTKKNIDDAVDIFRSSDCPFELMHCISTYPMDDEDANLETIQQLKEVYKCNVGYSGHENGIIVSISALSYGISSLERHITLDRSMYGSDQPASLEPKGIMFLSDAIDKFIVARGSPKLGEILDKEIPIANKLRSHLKF